jgi:hypothetical protein
MSFHRFRDALPAATIVVMVMPVPSTVTIAMIVMRNADTDAGSGSGVANMGTGSDTTGSDIRARAHTANTGAYAHVLSIHCAGREQRQGEH